MSLPWVRLDTGFPHNPKILGLIADKRWQAVVAYISAIAYCGEQETGGLIPSTALAFIHATPRVAEQLVNANLWETAVTGWIIHDWSDQQRQIDDAKERREKAKRAADARWHGGDDE